MKRIQTKIKRFNTQSFLKKKKQVRKRCVIYPTNEYKNLWDFYILILTLFTCIITPYRLAFFLEYDDPLPWKICNYFVDGSFAVDVILTFFSAYYDGEVAVVDDRGKIAKDYIMSWFVIDTVSVFPFEDVMNSGDFTGLVRVFRIAKIYKITKIVRLMKVFKFMQQQQDTGTKIDPGV